MKTRHAERSRKSDHGSARDICTASTGRPVEPATRARLEPRLGHSFADVRIHDGAEAETLASRFEARALTVGEDIYFGAEQYRPGTREGDWRLAHELAHTVQQAGAGVPDDLSGLAVDPDPALESTAREAGLRAVLGREVGGAGSLGHTDSPAVQRDDDPPYPTSLWDVLTDDVIGGAIDFADAAGKGGKWAGPLGGALGPLSMIGGGMDIYENVTEEGTFGLDNLVDTGIGGLNIFSGGTSALAALGVLPEVAGGTALSSIGGAGVATAGGQVAAAGLAGYGVGRLLDEGVGGLMNITGASDYLDEQRGVTRGEGEHGDYSISGMMADSMMAQDQAFTGLMRSVGAYDESAPEYTQTLGWQLAEILPSWLQ
jgi:hypothetical protein